LHFTWGFTLEVVGREKGKGIPVYIGARSPTAFALERRDPGYEVARSSTRKTSADVKVFGIIGGLELLCTYLTYVIDCALDALKCGISLLM